MEMALLCIERGGRLLFPVKCISFHPFKSSKEARNRNLERLWESVIASMCINLVTNVLENIDMANQ